MLCGTRLRPFHRHRVHGYELGEGRRRGASKILQQPLDIVEFELRAEAFAEAAAQLLENAARALHVDLARHLDGGVVPVVAPAQRAAERIGVLLRPRLAGTAGLAGAGPHLLLHHLRQPLRALAHGVERAALGIDGALGIAVAERAFGVAHGLAGAAELVHLALAGLLTLLALLPLLPLLPLLALLL